MFSPDGRTLYTAGYDGSVIVWDLGGARRLGETFRYTSQADGAATGSAVEPERLDVTPSRLVRIASVSGTR